MLPQRVDPDAWLATLDQKMDLRHVGRDPRVDVDLATYSIGPQMARRAVLLQVIAQSRQFAVWHENQIVKRLPIKGLVGQEMALNEYLQYIRASGFGISSTFFNPWGKTKSASLLCGEREPDSFLHVPTVSGACFLLGQVREKRCLQHTDKDAEEPHQSARWSASRLLARSTHPPHALLFLSLFSFSPSTSAISMSLLRLRCR